MPQNIDEKFAHYEQSPSQDLLEEIIVCLREESDRARSGKTQNKLGYCLLLLFGHSHEVLHLNKCISVLKKALNLSGLDQTTKVKIWSNLGDALQQRWKIERVREDLDDSISFLRYSVRNTPALDQAMPDKLKDLADALSLRYDEFASNADIDEAIHVQRLAMLSNSESSLADEAGGMDFLATLLEDRYLKSRSWYFLEECVIWRDKLASNPAVENHEDIHSYANCLSISLLDRYRLYRAPGDLQSAIRWAKKAAAKISSQHEDYPTVSFQLAVSLQAEWDRSENLDVLDEEIKWYKASLEGLSPGSDQSNHRHNLLGVALCQRADISRSGADVEAAIENIMMAKNNSDPGSDEYVRSLNNLSNVFESASTITCKFTPDAVQKAVEAAQQAQQLKPESELALYNLCKAKSLEYHETSSTNVLDACFEIGRKASQINPSPRNLGLLSIILVYTFHETGSLEALDEAIDNSLRSIRPGFEGSSDANRLVTLGNALSLRAQWKGTGGEVRRDISDAIEHLDNAVHIMAKKPGGTPPGYYSNLGYALLIRHDILGAAEDLVEATRLFEKALMLARPQEPRAVRMQHSNLANAYFKKYTFLGSLRKYLDKAVHHGKQALTECSSQDPRIRVRQNNLAIALRSRAVDFFDNSGTSDIDDAITLLKCASSGAGELNAEHPGYLHNLGLVRICKVQILGDETGNELQAALEDLTKAASLAGQDSPLAGGIMLSLSEAWRMQYDQGGQERDLRTAISYAERAATCHSATFGVRIRAAYFGGIWATQVAKNEEHRLQAARLLREAADLLPFLSPRDMTLSDQQRSLVRFNAKGISADSVASVLDADQTPMAALSLLETSRGVITGNLLACRSDLTALRSAHPEIANDFEELQEAYRQTEQLVSLSVKPIGVANRAQATDQTDPYHLRLSRIEDKIKKLLQTIHTHDAFKGFLHPTSPEELALGGFDDGYIVAINASQIRCDALLIHEGHVTLLPLEDLHEAELSERDEAFREAIERRRSNPRNARRQLMNLLNWLWETCGRTIFDFIMADQCRKAQKPRVWWLVGGVLGRLPLHACGDFREQPSGDYEYRQGLVDAVISSYIPTLQSLQYARQQVAKERDNESRPTEAIVVAVPESEGAARLGLAEKEASEVGCLLGECKIMRNPTLQEVVEALPTCRIAHFACHGITDSNNPSHSYLQLPDHEDHPLSVDLLMRLKMTGCGLAYLSACDTATSKHPDLVDESLHLVNGFLLAGCPRVVGTLWEVSDEEAMRVATDFYRRLPQKEGYREPEPAAFALHNTISELLNPPTVTHDPLSWAAFVHYGL